VIKFKKTRIFSITMTEPDLEKRTVILGFHNPEESYMIKMYLEFEGYDVQETSTLEGMRQLIESKPSSKGYWMDTNLGIPNGKEASSAIQIYATVKERVEAGKAMFLAMTTNQDAYEDSHKAGIPNEYTILKPAPSLKALIDKLNKIG
jgi:hypothetical protein